MPSLSPPHAVDLDAALPPSGGLALLRDVAETDATAIADALASARGLRLHRVNADDLAADRYEVLRGNLREVFDEAHGESLVLLTNLQVVLTTPLSMDEDQPEGPPPHERLCQYLLDRAEAFEGIIVLAVDGSPPGLDAIRARAVVVEGRP